MGQTQVKFLGTYMVPKVDLNLAATFQSTPYADIVAFLLQANEYPSGPQELPIDPARQTPNGRMRLPRLRPAAAAHRAPCRR